MGKINIALIDHNDSFTFNIVEVFRKFENVIVDIINYSILKVDELIKYDKIILSPGPCLPEDYPKTFDVIKMYFKSKHILGICLGHQAICYYFGADLYNFEKVVHGVDKEIIINDYNNLFKNVPNNTKVGLYHSWAVNYNTIPKDIEVLAITKDDIVMGVKHKKYHVYGIQFHPESFLTSDGELMLKNFIELS